MARTHRKAPDPYFVDGSGYWRFREHAGQRRMLASRQRFILALAGTQSGKTVSEPWWLLREMARRGPGDYIAASPTFPLMQKKLLPEFLRLFQRRLQLGTYRASDRIFTLSEYGQAFLFGRSYNDPTQIFFGHAQDPDALESATAKAAVLDEAGQKKFRRGSWEALQRRLSIYEGRALIATTPYTLGWLKSEVYDRAKAGEPGYDLIQFESTMNPAFPRAEFDRARRILPAWKFNMMYRGFFEKPAGAIYDCFSREENTCPRFTIPGEWPHFLGLDFGQVNTAGVYLARDGDEDSGIYYLYETYHFGGRTSWEHARELRRGRTLSKVVGGSGSEDRWRDEFRRGGLPVDAPPITGPDSVEVGIDRVYSLFKSGRLKIFRDLPDIIDDVESYSRELDDNDEPTEKIEDKDTYHRLDALRYIAAYLVRHLAPGNAALSSFRGETPGVNAPSPTPRRASPFAAIR